MKVFLTVYVALILSLLSCSVYSQSLIGQWKAIAGNEYRETIAQPEQQIDCYRAIRLVFGDDGIHTSTTKETPCVLQNGTPSIVPYSLNTYRYSIETKNEYLILKIIEFGPNALIEDWEAEGLIYFENEDVFYMTQERDWKNTDGVKYYFQRVKEKSN